MSVKRAPAYGGGQTVKRAARETVRKLGRKYVCNKCLQPFAPGAWGRRTGWDAYRHAYGCPTRPS